MMKPLNLQRLAATCLSTLLMLGTISPHALGAVCSSAHGVALTEQKNESEAWKNHIQTQADRLKETAHTELVNYYADQNRAAVEALRRASGHKHKPNNRTRITPSKRPTVGDWLFQAMEAYEQADVPTTGTGVDAMVHTANLRLDLAMRDQRLSQLPAGLRWTLLKAAFAQKQALLAQTLFERYESTTLENNCYRTFSADATQFFGLSINFTHGLADLAEAQNVFAVWGPNGSPGLSGTEADVRRYLQTFPDKLEPVVQFLTVNNQLMQRTYTDSVEIQQTMGPNLVTQGFGNSDAARMYFIYHHLNQDTHDLSINLRHMRLVMDTLNHASGQRFNNALGQFIGFSQLAQSNLTNLKPRYFEAANGINQQFSSSGPFLQPINNAVTASGNELSTLHDQLERLDITLQQVAP